MLALLKTFSLVSPAQKILLSPINSNLGTGDIKMLGNEVKHMFYVLALIGMVCWGIAPIFAKTGLRGLTPLVGLSVRTFFTAVILLAWLFIGGYMAELKSISSRALMLLIAEAIFAMLIGDLAYFSALKQGSASIVMLIMACSPLVTIICSMLLFQEKLTLANILGGCLAIIGLILII